MVKADVFYFLLSCMSLCSGPGIINNLCFLKCPQSKTRPLDSTTVMYLPSHMPNRKLQHKVEEQQAKYE